MIWTVQSLGRLPVVSKTAGASAGASKNFPTVASPLAALKVREA